MELKFIWIKNYKIIKNLGINFNHSDEHKFEYDGTNLKLIPNQKSVLDFGENITGVTAIAGKNGTGKYVIDGPFGHAYLRSDAPRDVVCVAGGSGLAPVVSIARSLEVTELLPKNGARLSMAVTRGADTLAVGEATIKLPKPPKT